MNLTWLKNLNPLHRNILGGVVTLLVLVLVGNFMVRPKFTRMSELRAEVAAMSEEMVIYQAKVQKLDILLSENERLKGLLEEQKRQLPDQQEVAQLLQQVTEVGSRAGLVFRLWRPGKAVPNESGLYQELPVDVEVTGSYHQLGLFFEHVAHMDRIVAISNVEISGGDGGGPNMHTQFRATAYAAPTPEQEEAAKQKKAGA
ncbi:MAG: type 4a pilus biogenesis protein PilO [Leptospirillia bacterium]